METISIILILLSGVIFSGVIDRISPFTFPRPLTQIIIGILIASLLNIDFSISTEVFFLLFLPPLLFIDGWRIPKEDFFRDVGTIIELALGLVVFTVLGIGFLVYWMIPSVPLPVAFALAAILSPTDPVAVSSIASRIPVPERLMHILEGESLLNDASGLVCMRFAVAAALTGAFSLVDATGTFLWMAITGALSGVVVSWSVSWATSLISRRFGDESGSQILVSLLIPFVAYLLAEHIEASGILAAVAAGITMSFNEVTGHASPTTRIERHAVWDTVSFSLNGVMFIFLGTEFWRIALTAVNDLSGNGKSSYWLLIYVVSITCALYIIRFIWVWVSLRFKLLKATRNGKEIDTPHWRLIAATVVAGARGAITLAGILTLPLALSDGTPFPSRDLVIFLAASVVIISLVAASIGLPFFLMNEEFPLKRLHKSKEHIVRVTAAEAAIRAVEEKQYELSVAGQGDLCASAAARVLEIYRERIDGYTPSEPEMVDRYMYARDIEERLWLAGLRAERVEILKAARARRISDETSRKLVREVDLIEARLNSP